MRAPKKPSAGKSGAATGALTGAAGGEFDVLNAPLAPGTRALIEAGAGTGKTHNIQHLYLRLIAESGLEPRQILVVTFTEAATAELRDRIRKNLAAATSAAEADDDAATGGAGAAPDPTIAAIIGRAQKTEGTARTLLRLRVAIAAFDEAAIHTIHGFCQRVLARNAFESGVEFDRALTTGADEIVRQTVGDFLRRENARGLAGSVPFSELLAHARLVLRHGDTLRIDDATAGAGAGGGSPLAGLVRLLRDLPDPAPRGQNARYRAALDALRAETKKFAAAAGATAGAPPRPIPARFAAALEAVAKSSCSDKPAELDAAITAVLFEPRRAAFARLRDYLRDTAHGYEARKRAARVLDYDDLPHLTLEALASPDAPLATALRATYAAALVDEFQDTDARQFQIFDTVFNNPASRLYMIGDPKQAIYGFRGGDIRAYLAAAAAVPPDSRFTLTQNFRSSANLIAAVNTLFTERDGISPFAEDGLAFHPARPSGKPPRRQLLLDGEPPEKPFRVVWLAGGEDGEPVTGSALEAERRVERESVARLVATLSDPRLEIAAAGARRRPTPGDAAILVTNNAQAERVQTECRRAGVPAVIYKAGDVFLTPDAESVLHVLAAAAEPSRPALLRAALLTPLCGLDERDLVEDAAGAGTTTGAADPLAEHRRRFSDAKGAWQRGGVTAALNTITAAYGSLRLAAAKPDCERRLTNLRHLAELLREVEERDRLGATALLAALRRRVTGGDDGRWGDAEACEQRMESDRKAAAIMTIHRSKGLEFPIVLCPFLMTASAAAPAGGRATQNTVRDTAGFVLPLGPDAAARWRPALSRQNLAEQARLLYVALTRASGLCVLFAGNVGRRTRAGATGVAGALNNTLQLLAGGASDAAAFLAEPPPSGAEPPPALAKAAGVACETVALDAFGAAPPPRFQPAEPDAQPAAAPPPVPRVPDTTGVMSYSSLAGHGSANATTGGADEWAFPAPAARRDILPAGRATGLCAHEVFEELEFDSVPAGGRWEPDAAAAALIERAATKRGIWRPNDQSETTRARRERLAEIIAAALNAPLDTGTGGAPLRLNSLRRADTLREWQFLIPAPQPPELGRFRALGFEFKRGAGARHGFITGILDLVFRHGEKFFFADWKTDALADYSPAALEEVMRARDYSFQAALYATALHRHLSMTLGAEYDFTRHFGGGHYLFVRGLADAAAGGDDADENTAAGGAPGLVRFNPTRDQVEAWSHDLYGI
ncbi:MAG: UvrD-helicase domain-containing protein [Puniceicoccales bacterium]|jgi:exodeoxyribonuclease V beta subunit|nr:UvrD-helicase domain-containing protein [Puniceicoccales bacterium]